MGSRFSPRVVAGGRLVAAAMSAVMIGMLALSVTGAMAARGGGHASPPGQGGGGGGHASPPGHGGGRGGHASPPGGGGGHASPPGGGGGHASPPGHGR